MLGSVMAALSITPISPATLSALSALRPLQAPAAPTGQTQGTTALSAQDLAQTLFQRTLQSATLLPLAEPATGVASLLQETTASLLASLTAPQAPAGATAATGAPPDPTTVQASDATTAASTTPTPALGDLPATEDALATSLNPDFAMGTALRFGAGVASDVALTAQAPDLGAGLVRDATSVLRTGNLQPRAGGPGPEAYGQPPSAIQRILRTYETAAAVPATQGTSAVDVFA